MENQKEVMSRRVLIVGLGNPGREYIRTRHNVGFRVVECVAEKIGIVFSKEKYRGLVAEGEYKSVRLYLLKPLTYMNFSGDSVSRAVRYCIDSLEDILVVTDDVNLPLGQIRLRTGGSSGGHKGLQSIIDKLHTENFPRLRIGIGINRRENLSDFVLGNFSEEENLLIEEAIKRAGEAVLLFVSDGIIAAMERYNCRRKLGVPTKLVQ